MKKFKLNSDKKVINFNPNVVMPQISTEDYKRRSFSLTPKEEEKINKLRAKYKISRSALVRILLNSVE